MGRSRRRRIALPNAWPGLQPAIVVVLLLAACSGGSAPANDLLLAPGDFPGVAVTETGSRETQTAQGQFAAQVELSGPDFLISQSVVMFTTESEALSALGGIKRDWDQLAGLTDRVTLVESNLPVVSGAEHDNVSGILQEVIDNELTWSVFFVEDRALVRLTISGPGGRALLPIYADIARSKIERQ